MVKIQQLAEWMTSLRLRHLRLQMHPSRVGPGAGAGLRYDLHLAAKRGEELTALESRAKADSFRLLSASRELAGEEACLFARARRSTTARLGCSRRASCRTRTLRRTGCGRRSSRGRIRRSATRRVFFEMT